MKVRLCCALDGIRKKKKSDFATQIFPGVVP